MSNKTDIRFLIPASKRLWLFVLVTVLCMVLGSVLTGVITMHGVTPGKLRVGTVIQDVMMFIVPAIAVAMMCTRTPAKFLMVEKKPDAATLLLVAATLIAAVPAMNCVVEWNKGIVLPESLHGMEEWMRVAEENAGRMTLLLFGNWSVAAYIVALMIAGVLAGVSEEMYFRGTLQRLIATVPVSKHVAVWTTAVIFSAVHMQFFGFVPRLLLGAYFGYLAVWTENLWIPVTAHVLNNTLAATSIWMAHRNGVLTMDSIGTEPQHWWLTLTSVVITALLIVMTYQRNKTDREQ